MNKDAKLLAERYYRIVESENIDNTSRSDASTKYTVDNTQKFLPIGQDQAEEEKMNLKSDSIIKKLEPLFMKMKTLIDTCSSKRCKERDIAHLLELMDNPAVKGDLQQLRSAMQEENMESGFNNGLAP